MDDLTRLAAHARNHARMWAAAGVSHLALSRETPEPASAPQPATEMPVSALSMPSADSPSSSPESLADIQAELTGCTRCTLAHGRTNLVFGVGNPHADLVFVGEAPGRDEDLQGEPFVGRAGKLLTDIIEKGMGIPRSSVYICNTVKCRPPENRNPTPVELASCEPYLVRQLLAIRPKVIVAMGKFAAQKLTRSDAPISRLRGTWHKYEGMDLMPTYHPAYLLRNPSAKKEVWADIQLVMAKLGLETKK